ncbi:Protein CBG04389 [Caenorhabditis briggsae]|uniref:Protein CBG04389 n=1 Tax=Caenorhabditis briggsae TaxID=6238 RepID=A8WXF4_CAEBR|nr:Protein CBG04389 [Caenorhabditis briggsae]CAP25102.2 Protein CBG04389 [Caenorhabditis briggsae]
MVQRVVVSKLLNSSRPLVFGMIHVPALPGTPSNTLPMSAILKKVRKEADVYFKNGVDGVIVENMHDVPYVKPPANPEIVSAMSLASDQLVKSRDAHHPGALTGIQILAAANREAIGVAYTTGLDFIRAEGFVYSHVADEGWIDGCAGGLLRYRSSLKADHVAVFTDIKKKHSAHSITADVSIQEMAKDAKFNCADGVIVTGSSTGSAAMLIGSGINGKNARDFVKAHGFIVGSDFKIGGDWKNELEASRITKFMRHVNSLKR